MRSVLAFALAALLSACGTTPAHLHTAGDALCDHRLEIRAATALIDPRPTWLDSAEASLDWLCAWLEG